MKNKLFATILLFAFFLIGKEAHGQVTYPITAGIQFTPPSTTYLTDLTAMGSSQLIFNLFLNDFNEPEYGAFLKISIEGNGISLITRPGYLPPLLTLSSGANQLYASDIPDYFNPNNMLINGISPQALQQDGSGLPEGIYTVCVQAFDNQRPDVPLSLQSCATQLFRKNYPPTLVTPACNSTIPLTGGNQDVFFNWHANADMSIQTNYKLSIAEVLSGQNPNDAINNAATLILDGESIMNMTTLLYGPNQQPLELGKRYAYRIQAEDILETTTFENDGFSPVCTFYYGVDPNGYIPITVPDNDIRISTRAQFLFKWELPTNAQPNHQLIYRLKIVEIEEGDDLEIALENGTAWYEVDVPNPIKTLPASLYQDGSLPAEKKFAWQIKAYTISGGEEVYVAMSERRIFNTAPEIEKIKAGNPDPNWIEVFTLEEVEILPDGRRKITGVGKMKVKEDGTEIDLHFTDIIVKPYEGFDWSLDEGTIIEPVSNFLVHLDNSGLPDGDEDKMDDYGRADFEVTEVIVEKDDLKLRGRVKWQLPHLTQSGNPIVQSELLDVIYNKYEIMNIHIPVEAITFDLIDPLGFKLNYFASENSNSEFMVTKNIFSFVLDGSMTTSNKVKSVDNQPVTYHFSNADNPYYFSATDVAGDDDFRAIPNTMIQVNPKKVTFDLSEEESPAALPNELWKGMYFDEFSLLIPTDFDGSNQMSVSEDLILNYIQDDESTNMCLISAKGLDLSVSNYWLDVQPIMTINTFKSNLSDFAFDVQENVVTEYSYIAGHLGLPCLSPYDYFSFNLDVANNGIQEATINEDLEGEEFTLNGEDYTLATSIKIKQAAFTARSHINMTIDFIYPAIGIEVENIANFKIWGNGDIGFNSPNSTQMFPIQQNGYVPGNQTYEFTADGLTAISHPETGSYGFVVSGAASIAENLSGGDKESRMDFASMKVKTDDSAASGVTLGNDINTASKFAVDGLKSAASNSFIATEGLVKSPNGGWFHELKFIAGPTIKFNTVVLYQPNDPVWGDVIYGVLDMDFGIPNLTETYSVLVQFINGKIKNETDDFSYGFVELGMGTSVEKSNAADDFKNLVAPDQQLVEIAESMDLDWAETIAMRNALSGVGNDMIGFSMALKDNEDDLKDILKKYQAKVSAASTAVTSTDTYKNLTKAGKQKYNALLAKGNKISAKLNTQCDKLAFQANKLYYGTEDTRNRSNAIGSVYDNSPGTRSRSNAMDESGQYSTQLRHLSYQLKQKSLAFKQGAQGGIAGIQDLANQAKNACASTGTMIKNKSKWAGGKLSKFANYTGTKFKKKGKSISDWVGKKQAAKKQKKQLTQIGSTPNTGKWYKKAGIPLREILLTGVQGRIYWHMSHDVTNGILTGVHAGEQTAAEGATDASAYSKMTMPEFPTNITFNYTPDKTTAFGLMFMASVESIDIPAIPPSVIPEKTGGKFRGYGAFEIAFSNGGYPNSVGIELKGDLINTVIPPFISESLLKAYLNIGFHYPEKKFKMTGYYTTASNALCGVGDLLLEISAKKTELKIGSPARKLFWLPGCIGWYATGYMHYLNLHDQNSSYLDLGLGLGWQATARKRINLVLATVEPYATIGAEIGLEAKIQFEPTTELVNFGGWIEAWASVGLYIDWPWPVPDSDIGLDATFSGQATITPGEPWKASGDLDAEIKVIGLEFAFNTDFNVDL